MSAQDARRRSSLGRRQSRPPRAHRLSMELPERLRYGPDEEEIEEEEDAGKAAQGVPFMHQSIFGMVAATQMNSQSRRHEAVSESEDEGDTTRTAQQAKQIPEDNSSTTNDAGPTRRTNQPRRSRLSEHKLLKSLPGLKAQRSKDLKPTSEQSTASSNRPSSQSLSEAPSPSPAHEQNDTTNAPFMSQMLQARAKMDIESSEATLTRPKSGRQSPSHGVASRTNPVALPDALKDIFDLPSAEEVVAEYPCWYLQSVLLEGYMYITQHHICFYAYLPKKGNHTIKSGYLSKRGRHNPHYRRWWFVLKGDVLSYYADPSSPYFPRDSVDLRYAISAELLPDLKDKSKEVTGFSVTTNTRTYYFRADSAPSAEEWVKQLQKIIFRSHNDGDSVKISIPTDNVIEIEENPLLDFADTIKIKVIDNDETFAMDEYFFSFLGSGDRVLHDLKVMTTDTTAQRALRTNKDPAPATRERRRSKSAVKHVSPMLHEHVRAELSPASAHLSCKSPQTSGELNRSSFDLGRATSHDRGRNARTAQHFTTRHCESSSVGYEPQFSTDSFATSSEQGDQNMVESMSGTDASGSHILGGSTMFHDPTIRKQQAMKGATNEATDQSRRQSEDAPTQQDQAAIKAKTEEALFAGLPNARQIANQEVQKTPPSDSPGALGGLMRAGSLPIQRASSYLKGPSKAVASLLGTSPMEYYDKVSGMLAGGQRHYSEVDGLSADDHVRDPDEEIDVLEAERRFRGHFALPDSERLVATYFAFLHRVVPLYGKIYVGTTKLCFRSLLPGTQRTKLIVPFVDVLNVGKEKGFRFGYQGMVVVVRGHEEIFFEFGKQAHRDDCTISILRALDPIASAKESVLLTQGEYREAEAAAAENLVLQIARDEGQASRGVEIASDIYPAEPDMPAVSFDDTGASMVDFKPDPLRIVCLTIGSRGDVQPYIALCKGLIADGHRPKIATHHEFRPWVESHGIDFAPIEGDPAELMRICAEHGMFTPSFLLEANLKFRGFVKTLLESGWHACKDADVLIESPSAMAGIHIAEALGIPYFRAFTMPWTRTRAYPHAFAVPSHKLGGAYNNLTYVLFEHMFWQTTSGMINSWRATIDLKPTNLERLRQDKVPFLYNFSPSVVVPPLDFSEWIHITGYWFLDEGPDYQPPSVLQSFIDKARKDGQKLVYIGFGSVVVKDSKQLTQSVVDAVIKADVRCILAKGWSDRLDKDKGKKKGEVEIPLPPSILQITDPVPHDWLFRQVDAVVHHGGAGTTGASLRCGVPTIIRPFFGDQYFFGSKVEDLGVGIEVKEITTKSLGRALWFACHDHRMREKAKAMGEQIRSEDGVANAIKAIYRDMEYAKSLIKKCDPIANNKKPAGSGSADTDEEDNEDWTLVENDSDPEAASPKAMMQPEEVRMTSQGRKKSAGLIQFPLSGRC